MHQAIVWELNQQIMRGPFLFGFYFGKPQKKQPAPQPKTPRQIPQQQIEYPQRDLTLLDISRYLSGQNPYLADG